MMKRIRKALSALTVPAFWPAIARGVVPGVEHGSAFVGRDFVTVLDVGANKGQFAAFARHRWPRARLICFEPLPEPRARLTAILGGQVDIHAVALGDYEGEADMHRASREDSSSMLPLGDAQKQLFEMDEERVVLVPIRRLDTLVGTEELARPALLKIDVQGYEFEALQGATGLLGSIDAVYVECSYIELYIGQKLAADVIEFLRGFGLAEAARFNVCRKAEKDIQADILFVRHL